MVSEMKVFVCVKPGELSQQRLPIPQPGSAEVLLKMCALGVCGSDIHAFHGCQPMMQYPAVLGHEISGEVVACGQDVTRYHPGQQVVVIPYRHCGCCVACRRGRTTCCTSLSVMGIHRTGAMQQYVTVAEDALVAVTGISPIQAALIEPYAIAAHAVRRSGVSHGVSLLVVGAGAIGLGIADIGRSLGAEVIVAEADPQRQAFAAEQYGFTDVLNSLDSDFDRQLLALTQVSNVLGTVNPVRDITAQAKAAGLKVLIDGAQAVMHQQVDVQALD